MDEESAKEVVKAIEYANQGNWIPLTVVAGVLGLVILLLIYIWKQKLKEDERRHDSNESILKTVTENQTSLRILVSEIKVQTEHNTKQIEAIQS